LNFSGFRVEGLPMFEEMPHDAGQFVDHGWINFHNRIAPLLIPLAKSREAKVRHNLVGHHPKPNPP
jgi:hypothetical protein